MERRLAAILAADLVGYSRMMGADEEGTLIQLSELQSDLVDPAVSRFRGRIVKTTGDGFLAEFASAVDAVNCAVSIQQDLSGRTGSMGFRLRIGINVGDVLLERGDVFGDGVNIAARLENLANPGGICISRSVHDHLSGKAGAGFRPDGTHALKNIARTVEVWRWDPSIGDVPAPVGVAGEKPSLAVLPFENMSADPEQGFFADGIAEDLITSLSKLSQLVVIARNSSFSYKGRSTKVQEIARDLGVRYLVEGSVRKAGNRVRVTAQLIDCRDGAHLWAERFDRDLTDIFEVQDEVTRQIIDALSIKLAPGDSSRIKPNETQNVEAYEKFLRGRELFYQHTREGTRQALDVFQASRDIDPGFAPLAAYASLAHLVEYINDWTDDRAASLATAGRCAEDAVALDPTYPYAHIALGNVCLWRRQHDNALAEYAEAIALDPNFAAAYMVMGWGLHFAGQPAEGVRLISRGLRLDPNYEPIRLHWLAQAEYQLGEYEQAAAHLRERIARQPHSDISHALLAATYGQLGQLDAAGDAWVELMRINPGFSVEQRRQVLPYKNPADFDRFTEGLRKAGIDV